MKKFLFILRIVILQFMVYIASIKYFIEMQRKRRDNNMDSLKVANTPAPTVGADTAPTVGADTVATQQAQPDKSARFKEKAENQTSKVMAEIEKLQKLSNKKYYTYSTEQINELFVAIQSVLDETKATFTTSNPEKKKLFTFSV